MGLKSMRRESFGAFLSPAGGGEQPSARSRSMTIYHKGVNGFQLCPGKEYVSFPRVTGTDLYAGNWPMAYSAVRDKLAVCKGTDPDNE